MQGLDIKRVHPKIELATTYGEGCGRHIGEIKSEIETEVASSRNPTLTRRRSLSQSS